MSGPMLRTIALLGIFDLAKEFCDERHP